jgi:hypothetical protein
LQNSLVKIPKGIFYHLTQKNVNLKEFTTKTTCFCEDIMTGCLFVSLEQKKNCSQSKISS